MLPLPHLIAAWILSAVIAFGTGHLYKAHRVRVENAAVEAATTTAQATVEASVTTADTVQMRNLNARIRESNATISALLREIAIAKEAARNEAPAAADCRLPDGLRDELNRALDAAGAEGTAAEVPRRGR